MRPIFRGHPSRPSVWRGAYPHQTLGLVCQAEAVRRFDGLRAEFEAFARQWDDVGRTVVLDTSAIIGLSSPDGQTSVRTVDWFALLDCPTDVALRLVVPLVVVDELNNFKDRGDNKSKPAARAALRTIEPLVVSTPSGV